MPMFFSVGVDVVIFNLTRLSLPYYSLNQYLGKVSNPSNGSIQIINLFAHPLRVSVFAYGLVADTVFEYIAFFLVMDNIQVVLLIVFS